jgi:hypothetical protein
LSDGEWKCGIIFGRLKTFSSACFVGLVTVVSHGVSDVGIF